MGGASMRCRDDVHGVDCTTSDGFYKQQERTWVGGGVLSAVVTCMEEAAWC